MTECIYSTVQINKTIISRATRTHNTQYTDEHHEKHQKGDFTYKNDVFACMIEVNTFAFFQIILI